MSAATPKVWPIDTCPACVQAYWACACGASPLGYRPEHPPLQCSNRYCHTPRFRWVSYRHCCESYTHHVGGICKHCGERD